MSWIEPVEEAQSAAPLPLSDDERWRIAEAAIAEVRPAIQADGGDIALADIRGDRIMVRLTGACVGCAMAGQTLGAVRRRLMQAFNAPVRVVPASD